MDGLFDRLPESGTIAAMSSQQSRGERVSDAEFDKWRKELETLYREKGASRQNIIDLLRIKYGKRIT